MCRLHLPRPRRAPMPCALMPPRVPWEPPPISTVNARLLQHPQPIGRSPTTTLRKNPLTEVPEPEAKEEGGEPDQDRVHHVEMHMRGIGKGRPHTLVDVDQRVGQHDRLQPVPSAHLDRGQAGPLVVSAAEEGDREDDETEHQPDVARFEGGTEEQPQRGPTKRLTRDNAW